MLKMILTVVTASLFATSVFAGPVLLSDHQLDSVAAGGVERVAGFVCPVLTTNAVLNSPKGGPLGIAGFYTIGGPDVMIPIHATNGAGNGIAHGPQRILLERRAGGRTADRTRYELYQQTGHVHRTSPVPRPLKMPCAYAARRMHD